MESISIFDMLKIGVGPSSSHTLGPWRAAERFVNELAASNHLSHTQKVQVILYGSLALTGKGHGTDIAVQLGLSGQDPVTIPPEQVMEIPSRIAEEKVLSLGDKKPISFDPVADIAFLYKERLPFHANGLSFIAYDDAGQILHESTFYSVGGGFVVKENEESSPVTEREFPFPVVTASDLYDLCTKYDASITRVVYRNEESQMPREEVERKLLNIWRVMKECIYLGCHIEGILPGGLNVKRRAAALNAKLMKACQYENVDEWMKYIMAYRNPSFPKIMKWISCFALAVNEQNANFGRVVTAPTNGAAGVIPAVLMYYICFHLGEEKEEEIIKFLMVAGQIGSIFKQGATISAAMGGCQAEIGVSSAMAAAALAECLGGSVSQALMAAEIAMEHHLGLTCDPIKGLVQIPCIERNSMGAVKAINAAHLAIESDPESARVSLDEVIKTMWETAQDMNTKYKETSLGGLATQVEVTVSEC